MASICLLAVVFFDIFVFLLCIVMAQFSYPLSLLVFSGPPLVGKTTVAYHLSKQSNYAVIDIDEIRLELMEDATELLDHIAEHNLMVRAYAELCNRAHSMMRDGSPVIIAGTFSKAAFKEPLLNLLTELEHPYKIFSVDTDDEQIPKRIEKRIHTGDASPIKSLEKWQWAKTLPVPWPEHISVDVIPISTNNDLKQTLQSVMDVLHFN